MSGDFVEQYKTKTGKKTLAKEVFDPLIKTLRNSDPPMRKDEGWVECTDRGSIADILKYIMYDLVARPKNIESELIDKVTENEIHLITSAKQMQNNNPGNKKFCSFILNGDYIQRYMKAVCHKERISQVYEPLLESLAR